MLLCSMLQHILKIVPDICKALQPRVLYTVLLYSVGVNHKFKMINILIFTI